jgi:cytochrome P450
MANLLVLQTIVALLMGFLIYRLYFRQAGPSLPPGPKRLLIVGNLMDLPPEGEPEFKHWLKHKETYGPISSVTVMGQTLVIIHDKQAAHYLLEKKSIKTSARPKTVFSSILCGFSEILLLQQYDSNFCRRRRFIHQQLGSKAAAAKFHDIQEVEARRFLLRVLLQPDNLFKHLKT